jgi:cytochrome c oxidase subunit III
LESGWGPEAELSGPPGITRQASIFGLCLLLVSSTVVFLSFTTAFLMRRSIGTDWVSAPKPRILFADTFILLVSSACVEKARRQLKQRNRVAFNRWWTVATVLGVLFLTGQAVAWRQLADRGFYMASTPSVSFFYMLTATHAAHVVFALAALIYVDVQAIRFRLGPAKRTGIDVSALFWHFLDVMWIGLMLLFYLLG